MPAAEDLEKAQASVRELFKADFAKTKAAERSALSAKLLEQSLETKDDAARFALLRDSRDLAAKAADAIGVLRATDEMTARFAIKPADAITPALDPLVAAATTTALAKQVAEVLLLAADEARFGGEWPLNAALMKSASAAASKTGGTATTEKVRAKAKDSELGRLEFEKAKEAFDTLKSKPADGAACTAAGRYLAFHQQEWKDGIALLSRGSDEKLQAAATRDLRAASGMEEDQLAAGDGWYDYAASAEATLKPGAQIRAHHWYLTVIATQSGLSRTRIEKRIAELQAIVDVRADRTPMWVAIRRGYGDDRIRKLKPANNPNNDKTFDEMPPGGGYLVGFHYTLDGNKRPNVIQPIYMTPFGEVLGGNYGVLGKKDSAKATIKAKPGYAVGALAVHGGGAMDGFKPVFMRIVGKGLNKADSYDGPQLGTQGELMSQGGDGTFIVGLHGKVNEKTGKIEAMAPIALVDEKTAKKKKK